MKRLIPVLFLFSAVPAFAQQLNTFYNNAYYNAIDRPLNNKDAVFHTSVRPYLQSEVNPVLTADSAMYQYRRKKYTYQLEKGTETVPDSAAFITPYKWRFARRRVGRALFSDHLLKLDSGVFQLYVDPVIDVGLGRDTRNKVTTYFSTKGAAFSGNITKKFSFYTAVYENQARFPQYLTNWINANTVIPQEGRPKPFGTGGFDYAWATGYVSYTPIKYLNIQMGHGKNFIGDGYRSLLLSDNSFNYPYLKLTANVWRIKYAMIYAQFQDLKTVTGPNQTYAKKYGVFHYIDVIAHKRLSIGLFESVIWEAADSTGRHRGFDANYLNPLIFFRPVEYSLGSPDNVVIGINLKYNFLKNQVLYGQIILDEFYTKEVFARNGWWANKQGFQLGFKSFDLFGIKNLYIQTEFNWVRPYTYTHFLQIQNYAHFNQPLAHPLGANFWESVSFLRYRYKRWWFEGEMMFARYGTDGPTDNYGGNLYKPYSTRNNEYGNFVGQGIANNLFYLNGNVSYIINPVYGLQIQAGATVRRQTVEGGIANNTLWFNFGLKTWLPNRYYDF